MAMRKKTCVAAVQGGKAQDFSSCNIKGDAGAQWSPAVQVAGAFQLICFPCRGVPDDFEHAGVLVAEKLSLAIWQSGGRRCWLVADDHAADAAVPVFQMPVKKRLSGGENHFHGAAALGEVACVLGGGLLVASPCFAY